MSGWSNEAYDAACNEALAMLPGMPGFVEAHQEAMRIFAQELPAMPLFTRMRLATTTPEMCRISSLTRRKRHLSGTHLSWI